MQSEDSHFFFAARFVYALLNGSLFVIHDFVKWKCMYMDEKPEIEEKKFGI